MANTTNFNWETPDDTDLVKDGAAAMRTLGNAIDASLVDLKGGTTGQVLAKNSNSDMDFTWTNGGDITEVAAGTGLTGGGTSGSVTLSLSTPVSATNGGTAQTTYATGDLLFASAANTLSKRAIGTTGQVLTVSGGVPAWGAVTGTMTEIARTTLNNTASTYTYSSLGSYSHIIVVGQEIRSQASTTTDIFIRFNGDTASNYFRVNAGNLNDLGSFLSTQSANNIPFPGTVATSGSASRVRGNFIAFIMDYRGGNRKSIQGLGGSWSDSQGRGYLTIGGWDNTDAITSITISNAASNIFQSGQFILYGV